MTKKILLLGAGGQLGTEIRRQVPQGVDLSAYSSSGLDITCREEVIERVEKTHPRCIINAAGYTSVDKAEQERENAFAVNAAGVENLALAVDDSIRLIHISTDFVFDGTKGSPYLPHDHTNPVNAYGASKLEGERILMNRRPLSAVIIRTAWLYAANGNNFVNTMLRLMASRDCLQVVDDQRGTPTSAASLARIIWKFVARPGVYGIFHWTNRGEASWYEFAVEIQKQALELGLLKHAIPIEPISTAQYPTPAARPSYSVLDKTATCALLNDAGRPWQEELRTVLEEKL